MNGSSGSSIANYRFVFCGYNGCNSHWVRHLCFNHYIPRRFFRVADANAASEIDSDGVVSLTTTVSEGTYTYTVTVSDDALPTANSASEVITFTVNASNSAPVLDDAYVADFTNITEHITDGSNVGQTVLTLLSDGSSNAIADSDNNFP